MLSPSLVGLKHLTKYWRTAISRCAILSLTLFSFCFFLRFDGGGVGAVAQAENGGDDKQRFNAQSLPDPAAKEGDENGDQVVDGNTGGQGGLDLVGVVRQILHIDVGGHGGQRDHRV